MKKRIVSLITATVMALSFMQASVSAASTDVAFTKIKQSDIGKGAVVTKDQTYDGKTGLLKVKKNSESGNEKAINFSNADISGRKYEYILIDCYYETTVENKKFKATSKMCKTSENKWFSNDIANYKVGDNELWIDTSADNDTNKWVTVAIDVKEFFEKFSAVETSGVNLRQYLFEFSDLIDGEAVYVQKIRFTDFLVEPEVYTDDNGAKYTYVSEDGLVTVDGAQLDAHKTINAALTALGTADGTVFIEGTVTEFEDVTSRGKILIRGIGDEDSNIENNVLAPTTIAPMIDVKGGDIEFDYMTMKAQKKENVEDSNIFSRKGYTITFGKHFKGDDIISVGARLARNDSGARQTFPTHKAVFNAGEFSWVSPLTNYTSQPVTVQGNAEFTFNGGKFNSIVAGSKNTWEWESSKVEGDVVYNFNGGSFDNILLMGSHFSGTEIKGNILWTINGGAFREGAIVAGNEKDNKDTGKTSYYSTVHTIQNTAGIVNLKTAAIGARALTLGTANAKGKDISGSEIWVLNNYECNKGTKIADGSKAEYKLHVYYGNATPIFSKDKTVTVNGETVNYGGALTGFNLVPDEAGATAYLNGVALTANSDGSYTIPANADGISEVVFSKTGSGIISFAKDGENAVLKAFNFTETPLKAVLFTAEFSDKDLKKVESDTKTFQKATNVQSVSAPVFTKTAEGNTLRAFAWESADSMNPIAASVGL